MNRKAARENAFILVFEKYFRDETVDCIIKDAIEARDFEYDDYVEQVFCGVFENIESIDNTITENLRGWKINRLSKVSLALMRVAVYEMQFIDEVPISVSINEAVELAKKYSTKDDASYINGVLGSIAKSIESR